MFKRRVMSYFLNIYTVNHSDVKNEFNLGVTSDAFVAMSKSLDPADACNIKRLYEKNYNRDSETLESLDANELIGAFEQVCSFISGNKQTVIEFYLDDENLPELFYFSFDDWDEDDFELPLSSDGTPSVVYRNNGSLISYHQKLKVLLDEGSFDDEYISHDELSKLVQLLSEVTKNNQGVFIFCAQ